MTSPTRLNPDQVLDPIITTMGRWYQTPVCLAPVEADPGTGGKNSDHLIPTMSSVDMVNNRLARTSRRVTVRPLPESGLLKLEQALREQSWQVVLEAETADEKADAFQKVAMEMVNQAVPEKVRRIASDDQDWYTDALKRLDRRRRREFRINRRSNCYLKLCQEYQDKCKAEKKVFLEIKFGRQKRLTPVAGIEYSKEFLTMVRVSRKIS